jgi:hypothetical protein
MYILALQQRQAARVQRTRQYLLAPAAHHVLLPPPLLPLLLVLHQCTTPLALRNMCFHHAVLQVTGGTAFGVISQGSDSLMGTAAAAQAGSGGYTGAALPGMSTGAMGGGVTGRRGASDDASGTGGRPSRQRSSAAAAAVGKLAAGAAGVLALLVPAVL